MTQLFSINVNNIVSSGECSYNRVGIFDCSVSSLFCISNCSLLGLVEIDGNTEIKGNLSLTNTSGSEQLTIDKEATFSSNSVAFTGTTAPSINALPDSQDSIVKRAFTDSSFRLTTRNDVNQISNMTRFIATSNPPCLDAFGYYQLAIFYPNCPITIRRAGVRGDVTVRISATIGRLYLVQFASTTSNSYTVLSKTNDRANPFNTGNYLFEDFFRSSTGNIEQFSFGPGDKIGVILYTNETITSNQYPLRGIRYGFGPSMTTSTEGQLASHGTYFNNGTRPGNAPVVGSSYFLNSGYAFYVGRFWLRF